MPKINPNYDPEKATDSIASKVDTFGKIAYKNSKK